MSDDVRVDPLTGTPVVIVAERQDRPNLPGAGCPFCPGGLEAPGPYDVRWFPNRWPPLPDGRSEVVLNTPRHDAAFASLGAEGALRVVDLWAQRTAALGARSDVGYVLVFENRGPEVGATIAHPHGQIYAYAEVPPVPRRELAGSACVLCRSPAADRVVCRADGWRAAVPEAPSWPFELLIAPDDHIPDLPSAGTARSGLAGVLVDALGRLDLLFDAPMPYMLWIHQRPTDGGDWPRAHLHVHIAPVLRAPGTPRFVAAAEVGGGVVFNPVDPLGAAAALRRIGGPPA